MKIGEIFLNRDKDLITILPGVELLKAVEILAANNIGALPVVSEDGIPRRYCFGARYYKLH